MLVHIIFFFFLHLISSCPGCHWNLCEQRCQNHLTPIKLWQRLHTLAGVNILYYYINFGSKCSLFILQLFRRSFVEPSVLCQCMNAVLWTRASPGDLYMVVKISPFWCNKCNAEIEHNWAIFAVLCQVGVRFPLQCERVLFLTCSRTSKWHALCVIHFMFIRKQSLTLKCCVCPGCYKIVCSLCINE